MRRFRVDRKEDKIVQRRDIERVRRISIYSVICISSLLNKWCFVNKKVKLGTLILYIILKRHDCLLCKCILLNVYEPSELHEFVNDYGLAQN